MQKLIPISVCLLITLSLILYPFSQKSQQVTAVGQPRISQASQQIATVGQINLRLVIGVNYWTGNNVSTFTNSDLPLLQGAGIKYIRLGPIAPSDFENCERLAESITKNGIDVIATFADEPDFGDYVYNAVTYFKGMVSGWIVLNEANDGNYSNNPVGYVELLKVAYTEAKMADPSVQVISTNLLGTGNDTLDYLREMYKNGAKGFFDILAVDPYCIGVSPLYPNLDQWGHGFWELPEFRNLMVQYGDGEKSIWIVEMGWRTPDPYGWFYVGDGNGTVSEATQANYTQEALNLASTWPWLGRYYVYEWMDADDPTIGYYGIVTSSYNLKPVYQIIKEFE